MPNGASKQAAAVTVINLKGGVGKTHTVWLLAGVCQERAVKVLVVDTDTQGNLTRSLLREGDSCPGVEVAFDVAAEADARGMIRTTAFSHIDLIPARPALARFDSSDQRQWEPSGLHLSLVDVVAQVRGEYDYIVFDCPPRLSLVSFAALCASDFVIIPLEAADWGAQGIVQVSAAIDHVKARYNPDLQLLGYLVSRFKRRRSYQRSYLVQLRKNFKKLAFDTVVPDLARFEKSVTHGIPITLHAPASVEAGIARRLFAEIQRRIGWHRGGRTGRSRNDLSLATTSAARSSNGRQRRPRGGRPPTFRGFISRSLTSGLMPPNRERPSKHRPERTCRTGSPNGASTPRLFETRM